jgi:hypothetical protein
MVALTGDSQPKVLETTSPSSTASSTRCLAFSFNGDDRMLRKEPMRRSDPINCFRREGLSRTGDN